LKSYRNNARDFFPIALHWTQPFTSDFPQGRYNDGLTTFLCAFRGLLPRVAQRPNVITFKVRPFSGLRNRLSNTDFYAGPNPCTHSHQIPLALRPSLRRSSAFATVFKVNCHRMEQLVELIRWLRKLTNGVRHKGMGHGQKNGLHLSDARKDTLQLCFSKNGPEVRHSARRHCG
jgi:hypothetical protein